MDRIMGTQRTQNREDVVLKPSRGIQVGNSSESQGALRAPPSSTSVLIHLHRPSQKRTHPHKSPRETSVRSHTGKASGSLYHSARSQPDTPFLSFLFWNRAQLDCCRQLPAPHAAQAALDLLILLSHSHDGACTGVCHQTRLFLPFIFVVLRSEP